MLQIQPQFKACDAWTALAGREGLRYEALEPVSPPYVYGGAPYEDCCEWYRASGRVTSLHGAFIDVNPASGDPLFRALSRQRCEESCSLAERLGAKNVVFHSSCFPFLRGGYLDVWAGTCADFYLELVERHGLRIFIENSPDLDPQPIRELMRRISDPRVEVCLDIGHAHYSRVPVAKWFDALGDWIGYLHLSDNGGAFDDHLPLGEGNVDWEESNRLWLCLDRDVPMTLEVGGISGVEHSLRYLRDHRYFGMQAD